MWWFGCSAITATAAHWSSRAPSANWRKNECWTCKSRRGKSEELTSMNWDVFFHHAATIYPDSTTGGHPGSTCSSWSKQPSKWDIMGVSTIFVCIIWVLRWQVIDCRRVLKFTYVLGYFLTDNSPEKQLFEVPQQFQIRTLLTLHTVTGIVFP